MYYSFPLRSQYSAVMASVGAFIARSLIFPSVVSLVGHRPHTVAASRLSRLIVTSARCFAVTSAAAMS